MTIHQFVSAKTPELQQFEQWWLSYMYPTLSEQRREFWDSQAVVWDWAERYDAWRAEQ
jgi:hypothetical protein